MKIMKTIKIKIRLKMIEAILNIILVIPVTITLLLLMICISTYYALRNIIAFILRTCRITKYKPSSILNSTIYILTKMNNYIKNYNRKNEED